MNVAEAMTPRDDVVTVSLPGTRDDVLRYLQEDHFSSVPVVKTDDGREVYRGLISREDLIEQPDEDQLALLMRDVPTVGQTEPIEAVARVVADHGTRRVPVVEDGELVGIITVTDVVRAIADGDADGDTAVGDLAQRVVNTTWTETPLPVVERELYFADVPYAVVLGDEGDMAGIVTEVDVIDVARVVEGEAETGDSFADQDDDWMWEGIKGTGTRYFPTRNVEIPAGPVQEFMTADVQTVTASRTAREVAQLLVTADVEQVPLVRGDELDAIVRDTDLLRALL
ncbi:MAG: CBS domain-containing protein [Halobacteriaceae archaeon]